MKYEKALQFLKAKVYLLISFALNIQNPKALSLMS